MPKEEYKRMKREAFGKPPKALAPPSPDAATPEQVMEEGQASKEDTLQKIADSVPPPTESIPIDTVKGFTDAVVNAASFLSDGQAVIPAWAPPEGVTTWGEPPPRDHFITAVAVVAAVLSIDPSKQAILPDLMGMTTLQGYKDATAKLEMLARDSELKAQVQRRLSQADVDQTQQAPPPGGMPEGAPNV
jgi:hypothetical protein